MADLYTGTSVVAKTAAEFSAYTNIQVSATDTTSGVALQMTTSGAVDFSAKLGSRDAEIFGFSGDDTIKGGTGSDTLWGNDGNDLLVGGAGSLDTLYGGAGDDKFRAGGTGVMDSFFGGTGNDLLVFQTSSAVKKLILNEAASIELFHMDYDLNGTTGADIIDLSGVDKVSLRKTFYLNGGEDIFRGSASRDKVFGGWGDDTIGGGAGNDVLVGGWGNDSLTGGSGNDYLNGSDGQDILTGGSGADVFAFVEKKYERNVDTITDFNVAEDMIYLESEYYTGLTEGALRASAFTANTSGVAQDASDRVIYETDTGKLYFDYNGSASGGRTLVGRLDADLDLTYTDFAII